MAKCGKLLPMISLARLELLLASFPQLTIGLVGDLFLDRYLEIEPDVKEMSIETGLEAYQVSRVRNSPGALGTVMNNLSALGVGLLAPVTVLGDDGHAYDLLQELRKLPVDARHVVRDGNRLTPTYTKPMKQDSAGVWRELNRLDVRTRGPLGEKTCERLCEELRRVFHSSDGLIVLDQINETNWGVVNDGVRSCLLDLADGSPDKLIFVDSRMHLGSFKCGVLKGNHTELARAVALFPQDAEVSRSPTQASPNAILARSTGRPIYCTQGEEGLLVTLPDGKEQSVPGYRVDGPVDIVGAGDSATSGIVASLLAGANWVEAAAVGNLVASITVQQLGTTGTASPEQVLARWKEMHP